MTDKETLFLYRLRQAEETLSDKNIFAYERSSVGVTKDD
jgi:hypothetical protein